MFFIPHSINLSFGLLGMMMFLLCNKRNRCLIYQTKSSIRWIIKTTFPIVAISIISCVINFSSDLEFVTYPVTACFAVFFSYLIAFLINDIYRDLDAKILIEYILVCQLIYMALSILMFVNPSIRTILLSILNLGSGAESAFLRTEGVRLICFGASFFTSGIVNGFVLIILSFYISVYEHSSLKTVLLYLYYILIIVVGMMMARTTLLGAGISFCVLCYYWIKSGVRIVKTFFYVALSVFFLLTVISRLSSNVREIIEGLSNFAFEFIINYQETGSAETASTNDLKEMYNTLPDNMKTWLIGDAKWQGQNGSYYKSVDVGYLRDIFYFGLIGLTALIYFYFASLKRIVLRNHILPQGNGLLFLSLVAFILILNLKGPADLFYYIVPFMYCKRNEYIR